MQPLEDILKTFKPPYKIENNKLIAICKSQKHSPNGQLLHPIIFTNDNIFNHFHMFLTVRVEHNAVPHFGSSIEIEDLGNKAIEALIEFAAKKNSETYTLHEIRELMV